MATRLVAWSLGSNCPTTRNGALVASQTGMAVAYGLLNVQERGQPFIGPGTAVYEGMIIGLTAGPRTSKSTPRRAKTSVRSPIKDQTVKLVPLHEMSLEESLDLLRMMSWSR